MWVARNKDNELKIFYEKPVRNPKWKFLFWGEKENYWICPYFEYIKRQKKYNYLYYGAISNSELNERFKYLTWEDNPVEIDIVACRPETIILKILYTLKECGYGLSIMQEGMLISKLRKAIWNFNL